MTEKMRWTYRNFVYGYKGTSFSINLDENTRMVFNPKIRNSLHRVLTEWDSSPSFTDKGVFPQEFFINEDLEIFKKWKRAELEALK